MAGPVPRKILYQRKRANRRILNEDKFLELLSSFAEVGLHCHPVLMLSMRSGSRV